MTRDVIEKFPIKKTPKEYLGDIASNVSKILDTQIDPKNVERCLLVDVEDNNYLVLMYKRSDGGLLSSITIDDIGNKLVKTVDSDTWVDTKFNINNGSSVKINIPEVVSSQLISIDKSKSEPPHYEGVDGTDRVKVYNLTYISQLNEGAQGKDAFKIFAKASQISRAEKVPNIDKHGFNGIL